MGLGFVGVLGIAGIGFIFGGANGGLGGLLLGLFLALLQAHPKMRGTRRRTVRTACPNPRCSHPLPESHAFCRHCLWVRLEGTELTGLLNLMARNALLVGGALLMRESMAEHSDPTVKYPLLLYGLFGIGIALVWQFRVMRARERT